MLSRRLEVFRREPGAFGYASQHARSDFFPVVERENDVGPSVTAQDLVGAA